MSEPLVVKVQRAGGGVVAELVVNPRRTVSHLKTQLEGIEGTPAGNQELRCDGRTLADDTPLSNLEVVADAVTVTLSSRPPLLSGKLTQNDLKNMLDSGSALNQAIDAYGNNPEYTPSEAQSIVEAVCRTLLSRNDCDSEVAKRALQRATEKCAELSQSTKTTLAGRRASFTDTVRSALDSVQCALLGEDEPPDTPPRLSAPPQESRKQSLSDAAGTGEDRKASKVSESAATENTSMERGAEERSTDGTTAPLRLPVTGGTTAPRLPETSVSSSADLVDPETPRSWRERRESLRPTGTETPRSNASPWGGAGSELQAKLRQRWGPTEGVAA